MSMTHNFTLSEEQTMILDTLGKLIAEVAGPRALEHDEQRRFVRASFEQLAELGMLGLPIAEASGGAGLGWLTFAVALEALAAACGSSARLWLAQAGLAGLALEGHAACADLASGARIAAFVGPEHGVKAREHGTGLALDGVALLVTAAMEADLLVVAATDAAGEPLLVLLDGDGVVRESAPALGFRGTAPGVVRFSGFPVLGSAVVATGAAAATALRRARLAALLGGGAIAVGMARASRELARKHAGERIAFGKPLLHQQAVAHKLVEALRQTEAARHLVCHAARVADAGLDAMHAAMLAKLAAVEAAVLSSDEAIQIHGGYGYTVEYQVERHYRDAKSLEVLDGGTEVLRDGLAAAVG